MEDILHNMPYYFRPISGFLHDCPKVASSQAVEIVHSTVIFLRYENEVQRERFKTLVCKKGFLMGIHTYTTKRASATTSKLMRFV